MYGEKTKAQHENHIHLLQIGHTWDPRIVQRALGVSYSQIEHPNQ